MNTLQSLENQNEFVRRHIGPSDHDILSMLKTLGFSNLDEMAKQAVPKNILSAKVPAIHSRSEMTLLSELKKTISENKVFHSMIGMGFYDTFTPQVILRNVFESPAWYTAYTPYQAEISQGRMEALLNFQTMITDLTGMEISNSSLLDEGSAAAEAMVMAHSVTKKKKTTTLLVADSCHPHVIEVLQTRAEPLGLIIKIEKPEDFVFSEEVFGAIVQYPNTFGAVENYRAITQKAHDGGALMIVSVDLLALTLITPPGEWGADIVVGNSQRFGVPLGFGGPHAAFMATKDAHKRSMPGRLVGVSVDEDGKPALRLTLQTREQHIRREKATSNICTAQVLLANMASFYAVYHGPQGLKRIAQRVHRYALILKHGLSQLGYKTDEGSIFDTISVQVPKEQIETVKKIAGDHKLNFGFASTANGTKAIIAVNETTTREHLMAVLSVFNKGQAPAMTIESLDKGSIEIKDHELIRKSNFLTHPTFNAYHSETEMLRYIHSLQHKDLSLTHSMIPLGSCTMKLNATSELVPVSWPEISSLHPFAPTNQAQGYLKMIKDLERNLCAITGFDGVSLQPNAGSQGEYAGLLVIRKYFQSVNQAHRNICLIPSSAHGTNPASAAMAGMQVVVVNCDAQGNVDIADLKTKAELNKNNLAALMITYPSTHGVFEEGITDICKIIHDNGGQVYMDGANLNALVGLCYPGEFGPDVSHMNLHKTFAIPHGGGGPGVGPIGVKKHLTPFLPKHSLNADVGPTTGVSATTSGPWGSASILPISWMYINLMGGEGLRKATLVAILSANYIAKKLAPHFPILYKGKEGLVAHECIIDLRDLKKDSGIDVTDVAKRLMDYGFHAPTMSWPVAGTLMIEPTESEPKSELDRFCDAMIQIKAEIDQVTSGKLDKDDNPLKNAPHTETMLLSSDWNHKYSRELAAFPLPYLKKNKFWPNVRRVDNAYGDRNVVCACPPIEAYQ